MAREDVKAKAERLLAWFHGNPDKVQSETPTVTHEDRQKIIEQETGERFAIGVVEIAFKRFWNEHHVFSTILEWFRNNPDWCVYSQTQAGRRISQQGLKERQELIKRDTGSLYPIEFIKRVFNHRMTELEQQRFGDRAEQQRQHLQEMMVASNNVRNAIKQVLTENPEYMKGRLNKPEILVAVDAKLKDLPPDQYKQAEAHIHQQGVSRFNQWVDANRNNLKQEQENHMAKKASGKEPNKSHIIREIIERLGDVKPAEIIKYAKDEYEVDVAAGLVNNIKAALKKKAASGTPAKPKAAPAKAPTFDFPTPAKAPVANGDIETMKAAFKLAMKAGSVAKAIEILKGLEE